MDSRFELGTL